MPDLGLVGPLLLEPCLDRLEYLPIKDCGLLSWEGLSLEPDLANVKAVAQEVRQRPPRERDAANGSSVRQVSYLGRNTGRPQIGQQQIETAEVEIALEDVAHDLGLFLHDGDLPVFGVVSERSDTADPKAFAFGGPDLVADAFGRDFARTGQTRAGR